MNSNLILSLICEKAPATTAGNESASCVSKYIQPEADSFLSVLRARLANTGVLPEQELRLGSCPDHIGPGKMKPTAPKETSDQSSDGAGLSAGPWDHVGVLAPKTELSSARAHGETHEAGGWQTSQGQSSSERLSRGGSAASVTEAAVTSAEKTAAGGSPAREMPADAASQVYPAERPGARGVAMGGNGSRAPLFTSNPSEESWHSNNGTFRQASVGIWRRVHTNEGHTQPHSRPSESRQNSYLPAKISAARRWLLSEASRLWDRSESHHPSFRALGHPKRGDSKTSGLKSPGRPPSLSKVESRKSKVQSPKGEVEGRKSKVESRKSKVESPDKGAAVAVRRPERVNSDRLAGVVNTKAASGQASSRVLREAQLVDAIIEGRPKRSVTDGWREMSWSLASDLRAKDGAPAGFQAILGTHSVLIPQVVGYLRRLSKSGKQEMSIRLNPPELGAMRIRIRVAGEGVKATLLVERPQVQALLEEGMPALMRALQEQGLKVDSLSVEVSHGSDDFGLSSQSDGRGGERGLRSFPLSQLWPELIEETILPTAPELLGSKLLDVVA